MDEPVDVPSGCSTYRSPWTLAVLRFRPAPYSSVFGTAHLERLSADGPKLGPTHVSPTKRDERVKRCNLGDRVADARDGGFLPIVGAIAAGAAAALVALVALVAESLTAALLVVAATIAVQQIEGNLLQPFIVGRALRLHPIAVLLAVTAGAVVWGIPGAVTAVPLTAVVAQGASYLRSGDSAPAAEEAMPAEKPRAAECQLIANV